MPSPTAGSRNSSKVPSADRPTSSRGRTPRGGFSKDKILSIATKMFSERGFSTISIRDIATACNVSIPSIYHYYGDKESLYLACYETTFAAAAEKLRGSIQALTLPKARVKKFVTELCEILLENHEFRRLLQREILREERRHISQLTTHHFQSEFKLLTHDIAQLSGTPHAMERAFSIYALSFGLIQLRRIGELAGMDKTIVLNPANLAKHVLDIVIPGKQWGR